MLLVKLEIQKLSPDFRHTRLLFYLHMVKEQSWPLRNVSFTIVRQMVPVALDCIPFTLFRYAVYFMNMASAVTNK
jgi:hypothetical protein